MKNINGTDSHIDVCMDYPGSRASASVLARRARGLDARPYSARGLVIRLENEHSRDGARGLVQSSISQVDARKRQVDINEGGIATDGVLECAFREIRSALLEVFAAKRLAETGGPWINRLDLRVRPLRQSQVGLAQAIGIFRIVIRQIHQRAVLIHQADDVVDALAGVGTLKVHGRLARHQLGRDTELGHGSLGLPQGQQTRPGKQM